MEWEDSFHLITFCSHLSSPEDTPDEVLIWKVLIKIQLRRSFGRNILVNFSSINTHSKHKFSKKQQSQKIVMENECFCFNGDGGKAREPLLLPFYWQNVSNDLSCLIPDQRKVFINLCGSRVRPDRGEVTRTGFCAFSEQKEDLHLSTCWFIKRRFVKK